jgi:hypothetical protein
LSDSIAGDFCVVTQVRCEERVWILIDYHVECEILTTGGVQWGSKWNTAACSETSFKLCRWLSTNMGGLRCGGVWGVANCEFRSFATPGAMGD